MSNMSYCRFENTLSDLNDCYYALQEPGDRELSKSESRAKESLIALCKKIYEEFGEIEEEKEEE